jgi:hypothetical protein
MDKRTLDMLFNDALLSEIFHAQSTTHSTNLKYLLGQVTLGVKLRRAH